MIKIPFLGNRDITSLLIMAVRITMMAAKFALSIFLARYMGLEVLGIYALLASAATIIPVFCKAGLPNILMRNAVTQSPEDLARNLFHYYAAVSGIYVLLFPVVCIIAAYFDVLPVALLMFSIVLVEHVVTDWFYLIVALKKPLRANIMLATQAGAWMIAFMVLAWVFPALRTLDVMLVFWMGGGVIALLSAIGFWKTFPWRSIRAQGIERCWYSEQWKKSRLFYVSDIAHVGSLYLDRYLIGLFLGLEMTGVYMLFWQMANAVFTLVTTGVLQIYRPKLIESHAKGDRDVFASLYIETIKKILTSSVMISVAVAVVAVFVTQWTDKPLALQYLPLLWLLLAAICIRLVADVAGSALYAKHMDGILVLTSILQCLGSVVFVAMGLYVWGVYGAAAGAILIYILMFIFKHKAVKRAGSAV